MTQCFLRLGRRNIIVITRWLYKRGGSKARFHCIVINVSTSPGVHQMMGSWLQGASFRRGGGRQPRSQGMERVGENPGNEVGGRMSVCGINWALTSIILVNHPISSIAFSRQIHVLRWDNSLLSCLFHFSFATRGGSKKFSKAAFITYPTGGAEDFRGGGGSEIFRAKKGGCENCLNISWGDAYFL